MHSTVLIIGAGPTGLTLASECDRYGIPFRLIDKKTTPTKTSNALALQTRTLDMLDDMGLLRPFLEQGHKVTGICFYQNQRLRAELTTQVIPSAFPFVLVLPQSETESILTKHLASHHHSVERGTALIALKQEADHVTATLQTADGNIETINTPYLIACDGAHSAVRGYCDVAFDGTDLPTQFILADAEIQSAFSHDQVHIMSHQGKLLALFPLPDGTVRLVSNRANAGEDNPSLTEFQDIASICSGNRIKINHITWSSAFWIHSRSVATMQTGRIFFLGDSAHIHSPAGGQGMNTGMQDAYNLAWKLANVMQGKAPAALLQSYTAERLPIAKGVLKDTERMTHLALSKNPLVKWIQKILFRCTKNRRIQKAWLMHMTQLSLRYRNSPTIAYGHHANRKAPCPGSLAPDVDYINHRGAHHRLYESLHNEKYHCLIFTGPAPSDAALAEIKNSIQYIRQQGQDNIEIVALCQDHADHALAPLVDELCLDKNRHVHRRYHAKKPALFLLRPDNVIAYATQDFSLQPLQAALTKMLFTQDQVHPKTVIT